MSVFSDLDEVLHSDSELIARHGGDDHGVELGSQFPQVLFIGVHQALTRPYSLLIFKIDSSLSNIIAL